MPRSAAAVRDGLDAGTEQLLQGEQLTPADGACYPSAHSSSDYTGYRCSGVENAQPAPL